MLIKGIERMSQGLTGEFTRLRALSQNQANLDTPGFRQTLTGVRQGTVEEWRDDRQEKLKETSRDLDLAPPPGAYFEVGDGTRTFLTTRGDLDRDPEGYLVIGSGQRILDVNGSPIKVPRLEGVTIDEEGEVRYQGTTLATLNRLTADQVVENGGTLYTPADNAKLVADSRPLSVGFLCDSNAEVERNQTDLVSTIHRARVFAQAITLQDATIERAFRGILGN